MEPIPKIRAGYQDLFNQYPWELHITFFFPYYVDFGLATKQVKNWFRKLRYSTFKEIKFAGLILLSKGYSGNTHVHVLFTSDQNYQKTLSTVSRIRLKLLEMSWHKGSCRITTSKDWDNHTISWYFAKKKNLKLHNPDNWDIYFYRPNLLMKLRYQ